MSALAQKSSNSRLPGVTPLPVYAQRNTTTAPPPAAIPVPPIVLPAPTPRPSPHVTPQPTPRTTPRVANAKTEAANSRISGDPHLPCADCDTGNGQAPPGSAPSYNYGAVRTLPQNQTGNNDLGSRNFYWAANLVSLPGRAEMDYNVTLSYNSLLWVREGSFIKFNADLGTPAPGFMMGGFPKMEPGYLDQYNGRNTIILVMPNGGRVELHQNPNTYDYESEDGSFLRLVYSGSGNGDLWLPGGTRMHFINYRCTYVIDRNGNNFAITYASDGHITQVADTLNRIFYFNYTHDHSNPEHNLASLTQYRYNGNFTWATFEYGSLALTYNFTGLTTNAPASGTNITVLTRVNYADGASTRFEYTPYGQVKIIKQYAANGTTWLSQTRYDIDPGSGAQTDCPRFTERRVWAREWNGDTDGAYSSSEEAVTTYNVAADGANGNQPSWSQVTTPAGVTFTEIYDNDANCAATNTCWRKGLTLSSETRVGGVKKKWVDYTWQQTTNVPYPVNPRLQAIQLNDDTNGDGTAENKRRTEITYDTTGNNPYNLPQDVKEFKADTTTLLRYTRTEYEWGSAYLDRRLIGLVKKRELYGEKLDGGGNPQFGLLSKTTYDYDWGYRVQDNEFYMVGYTDPSNQLFSGHASGEYHSEFRLGRGNLTETKRWDVTDPTNESKTTSVTQGYDIMGSVRFIRDALGHTTRLDYRDRDANGYLSVGNWNVRAFAFVTSLTDPEQATQGNPEKTYAGYDYEKGLALKTEGLKPAGQSQGVVQTYLYDTFDRLEKVTTENNQAYTRWEYPGNGLQLWSYRTIQEGAGEAFAEQRLDGLGQVIRARSTMPGSEGGYRGQVFVYDSLGRLTQSSYPLEVDYKYLPLGDDAGKSWTGPLQAYDWQGRLTVTTNVDGAQRVIAYEGCGCAGQDITTVRDEGGRRRKYYKDIAGRLVKVEELNWDQTVYSTATYDYNGRDQLERIRQNGGCERKFEYDGHGRLFQRTTPEQGLMEYAYNVDDTVNWFKDARNVKTTFGYNPRHLATSISYDLSQASGVAATNNVALEYDAAGNRTLLTENGQGSVTYGYDELSRLTSETRRINAVTANGQPIPFIFNYAYNLAGELKTMQSPLGTTPGAVPTPTPATTTYNYNAAGEVTSVTGSGPLAPPTTGNKYIDNIAYRAFGGLKQVTYGNGRTLGLSYNNRLFLSQWDLPNNNGSNTSQTALGYEYDYNKYGEGNTGRPDFADSKYDATLDRAWTYDQVGRLIRAYTGTEANGDWESAPTGPYAQGYDYDQYGNLVNRYGWGGENPNSSFTPTAKNQNPNHAYDVAGNVTNDGGQAFSYDATGQQATAANGALPMGYDGDGLRLKKTENGVTTYYLRSTVLGQQVAAEFTYASSQVQWQRGYVYLGGQLLAIQDVAQNKVLWAHQEPYSKGQRLTNSTGAIETSIELDPFGGQVFGAQWSWQQGQQPKKYTSYERDGNGSDEAMFRRYNRWHSRFDQPDPYDGSYSLANPQSLNRYGYVNNDPVNFVDPTGLNEEEDEKYYVFTWEPGWFLWWLYFGRRGYSAGGGSVESTGGGGANLVNQVAKETIAKRTCGNNPVTNEPGFITEPRGVAGNLRLGAIGGRGEFGAPREGGRTHRGLDIAAPVGTPIYANRAGIVTLTTGGKLGNNVRIAHESGSSTGYAHLQSFAPDLANGSSVAQGQLIGYAGQTGNAAGQPANEAHLHNTATVNRQPVNPAGYLNSPCPQTNNRRR